MANLDQNNPILGKKIVGPFLQETIRSNESFCETYKVSQLQSNKEKAHIFSRKIVKEGTNEVVGIICLCFRFENEMEGIFKKLSTDYDGSVILIINENNLVIASSDGNHVPVGVSVETATGQKNSIVYYRGTEYISKTVATKGYQGYLGLGWKGNVLIPVSLAFKEKATKMLDTIPKETMTGLIGQADSFVSLCTKSWIKLKKSINP